MLLIKKVDTTFIKKQERNIFSAPVFYIHFKIPRSRPGRR